MVQMVYLLLDFSPLYQREESPLLSVALFLRFLPIAEAALAARGASGDLTISFLVVLRGFGFEKALSGINDAAPTPFCVC